MGNTSSYIVSFSSSLIRRAFENFDCPWDVQTGVLLVPALLTTFQVLRRVKQLCKNTTPSATRAQCCAAARTPTMSAAATWTPVTSTVAAQTPAAEPENQGPQNRSPPYVRNGHKRFAFYL